MELFSVPTFREKEQPDTDKQGDTATPGASGSECPHFAGFLAVCFSTGDSELGLHASITNLLPDFDDVSLGGGSMDVRKVKAKSFPSGLSSHLFTGREFVIVKHPRVGADNHVSFTDAALELQILRHDPIAKHENIIKLLAVMYHDTGQTKGHRILPALVLECAEFGSMTTFQESGCAETFEDKIAAAMDTAKGLEALHSAGIIHSDVKPSNLLVCKHHTRKFIVKLSDFGFSMSAKGGRLMGSTEAYRAPEGNDGQVQNGQLQQMDVYAYGLTLWTIMSDGFPFYKSIPDSERSENMYKMKKSNMMPALATANILHRMRNQDYHLLILCKILFYCLQSSPKKRFRDMSRIINLLNILQTIMNTENQDNTSVLQSLVRAMPSAHSTNMRDGMPSSQVENTNLDIIGSFQSIFMEHGTGQTRLDSWLASFKSLVSLTVPSWFERYFSNINEQETPLLSVIQDALRKRTQREIFLAVQQSKGDDGSLASTRSMMNLLLDCAGLVNEPEDLNPITDVGENPSHLRFYHGDFVPEISAHSSILQKTPKHVQQELVESLKTILLSTTDSMVKARASLSLANAYVNEIGVEYELNRAMAYVIDAANLGLEEARTLCAIVFSQFPGFTAPTEETFRTWLIDSAEAGSPAALRKLEVDWPLDAAYIAKKIRNRELERFGVNLESLASALSLSPEQRGLEDTRTLLIWSIIEDAPDSTASCLRQYPELLERSLANGETPLIMAARFGRRRTIEAMLKTQKQPHIASLSGSDGVTSLHWLCSFEDEHHAEISALLCKHGANPNSPAIAVNTSLYGPKLSKGSLLAYTPLHWAVVKNRLSAVEALLDCGADPNFRMETAGGQEVQKSPFEVACLLSYSSIVARLLEAPSVCRIVDLPVPMVNGNPVLVRPLFSVLRGSQRWDRLLNNGTEFETETLLTIMLLIDNGATTDAVLQVADKKMPAVLATAYHQCCADIMISGLQLGFDKEIDQALPNLSSGGSALFLAITHHDRAMFRALLDAGASIRAADDSGLGPLERAGKETDDIYFAEVLLAAGAPVDHPTPEIMSAFHAAVYCGNFVMAKYLYDQGADRDRLNPITNGTILAELLKSRTRNSLGRIKFLLSLPDRDGSDGFIPFQDATMNYTVFHLLARELSEFDRKDEITGIMASELFKKYNSKNQVNYNTAPDGLTALAVSALGGNYILAQRLLEHGADPNITDALGRTALDIIHTRYCYPEATSAFTNVDMANRLLVERTLATVNENTSEIIGLLNSYDGKLRAFRPPSWLKDDPGYRNADWVIERLRASRLADASKDEK